MLGHGRARQPASCLLDGGGLLTQILRVLDRINGILNLLSGL